MASPPALDATGALRSGSILVRISVPEQDLQKCLQFELNESVWTAKENVLTRLAKDVGDAMNYGLYLPPANGRSGKFLEEERRLGEYSLKEPIALEFKRKKRDYTGQNFDEKQLMKINSKVNQKKVMDHLANVNADKLRKILVKGLDPNFFDEDTGITPLALAIMAPEKHLKEIILTLVENGAYLDFRLKDGQTAMHKAATHGKTAAIETMLDLGASPNYRDSKGLTPLYYSAMFGSNADCFELLLREHSLTMVQDGHGWQEIHQVCKNGKVRQLEHLIYYGVNINAQNATGNTALHISALNNREECARILLFRGANQNILNFSNQKAYQVAIIAANYSVARLIEQHTEKNVVKFKEEPTYKKRRRSNTFAASSSLPRLRSAVSESSLMAVSALSPSKESTEPVKNGLKSDASTPQLPRSVLLNGQAKGSPPSPKASIGQRRPSHEFDAGLPPSSSENVTSPLSDNVTVQLHGNPYESLRRMATAPALALSTVSSSSPKSILKKSVRTSSSSSSSSSSSKTLPRNVKFSSSVKEPSQSAPSSPKPTGKERYRRLYPAVAGRKFIAVRKHVATNAEELAFEDGDEIELLYVGNAGMWEGRVGKMQGWFPSNVVKEMQSTGHMMISTSPKTKRDRNDSLNKLETRIITLAKEATGLGFSVRGAKSSSPTLNFKPTAKTPSLQYVGTVDPGGVAQLAGLKVGDYILEVNGKNVVKATHSELVKLVKSAVEDVKLKVTDGSQKSSEIPASSPSATRLSKKACSPVLSKSTAPPSPETLAKILTSGLPSLKKDADASASVLATPPRPRSQSLCAKGPPPPLPRRDPSTAATYASPRATKSGDHSEAIYENMDDLKRGINGKSEPVLQLEREKSNSFASQLAAAASKMSGPKRQTRPRSKSLSVGVPREDDPISVIAKIAAERRARIEAKAKASGDEPTTFTRKDKKTEDDAPVGELQKALAARQARKNSTTKLVTEEKAMTVEASSPDKDTEHRAMGREDSDVRIRALTDAASRRQMRPPRVSRTDSPKVAGLDDRRASFDLSAVLHAVPPPPLAFAGSLTDTGKTGGVASVVVQDQSVDVDIDKALELWGSDEQSTGALNLTAVQDKDRDVVRLDDTEPEKDDKATRWDDIVIPPPVDMDALVGWEESESEESSLHIVGINSPPPIETFLSPDREGSYPVFIPPPLSTLIPPPEDDTLERLPLPRIPTPPTNDETSFTAEIDVSALPPPSPSMYQYETELNSDDLPLSIPPPIDFSSTSLEQLLVKEADFVPLTTFQPKAANETLPGSNVSELADFDISSLPPLPVVDFGQKNSFDIDIDDLPPPVVTSESEMGEDLPLSLPPPVEFNTNDVVLSSLSSSPLPPAPPPDAFSSLLPALLPPPAPHEPPPFPPDDLEPPPPVPSSPPPPLDDEAKVPLPPENERTVIELTQDENQEAGVVGFERKPFLKWTAGDVSDWLASLGLEDYAKTFMENEIEGHHLAEMSKDDLKELGVARLGHRLTLGNAIAKLRKGLESSQ